MLVTRYYLYSCRVYQGLTLDKIKSHLVESGMDGRGQ